MTSTGKLADASRWQVLQVCYLWS